MKLYFTILLVTLSGSILFGQEMRKTELISGIMEYLYGEYDASYILAIKEDYRGGDTRDSEGRELSLEEYLEYQTGYREGSEFLLSVTEARQRDSIIFLSEEKAQLRAIYDALINPSSASSGRQIQVRNRTERLEQVDLSHYDVISLKLQGTDIPLLFPVLAYDDKYTKLLYLGISPSEGEAIFYPDSKKLRVMKSPRINSLGTGKFHIVEEYTLYHVRDQRQVLRRPPGFVVLEIAGKRKMAGSVAARTNEVGRIEFPVYDGEFFLEYNRVSHIITDATEEDLKGQVVSDLYNIESMTLNTLPY